MRVFLARHAEAEQEHEIPDHDRALTFAGRREAEALGTWLASRAVRPVALCSSSAVRALATAAEIRNAIALEAPLVGEDALYLASVANMLAALRVAARGAGSVILVAHNPGILDLAVRLAARGERASLARLSTQFPPAACAEIELPDHPAGGIVTRDGELIDCFLPGKPGRPRAD